MLRLKLPTDPRWVDIAQKNINEILTDHAYCEQKAASADITFLVPYHEYPELVDAMSDLAREEIEHFQMVHDQIKKRGLKLGYERKDDYVKKLRQFFKGGDRVHQLTDNLLLAAMIEARSCERFRVLSEGIEDPELKTFYSELMKSEAMHYTMFLKFAREIGGAVMDVDKKWQDFLSYEAKVIATFGKRERIHG